MEHTQGLLMWDPPLPPPPLSKNQPNRKPLRNVRSQITSKVTKVLNLEFPLLLRLFMLLL